MPRHDPAVYQSICPICGQSALTLTADHCCGECDAVLHWFQNRLDLVGYRPLARISLGSSFAGDLAIDSLDLIEIICDLEHDFDLAISGNDAILITTVGDAVACIRRGGAVGAAFDIGCDAPRWGLRAAPSNLRHRLSNLLGRIRKPR